MESEIGYTFLEPELTDTFEKYFVFLGKLYSYNMIQTSLTETVFDADAENDDGIW